jgi:hypothetical protein
MNDKLERPWAGVLIKTEEASAAAAALYASSGFPPQRKEPQS